MTPLNQRRWGNFRANRRGYYSLWLFTVLFAVSLFAEFLANDKPLLVYFDGDLLVPVVAEFPETRFGGEFPTEADYRDEYVVDLIEAKGWMVWPPIPYAYDTIVRGRRAPAPPSAVNWLGTDDHSRDVLARLIYGFRISVLFGLVLTVFSMMIGVSAGAVQGYFGGWLDLTLQRLMEVWSSMPTLYLLIILSSVVQPNFWWLLGILLLFSWMGYVGVVRAEFLRGAKLRLRARGAGARGVEHRHHVPPRPAQRHGGHHHLFAVQPQRRRHRPHGAGFPGLRPAARLAVVGRNGDAGAQQPARPVAGADELLHPGDHADPAHFHRRSGARRL